jgi:O-antigen ligase/Tfp pilus assembly protein PilF
MTKKIIQTCDIVMEVTWLLALVSIPIYFNIYTSRVFEPDKITFFRSLVLVMLVAWAAKGIARVAADRAAGVVTRTTTPARRGGKVTETTEIIYPEDGEIIGPDSRPLIRRLFRRPMVVFVLVLTFIYLIATIFSIVPGVSWWGSYQRLQGTYTFLTYVGFFLVLIFNIRERRQIERLISFVLLANIPVALYGILQHLKADPLPWQGDVVFRVTSTMGNAIFISAYLIMALPLSLYRAVTTGNWLIKNRNQAGRHMQGRPRNTALSWIALYIIFLAFMLGLFLVILNFNANYRPTQTTQQVITSTAAQLVSNNGSDSTGLTGSTDIGPWWALPLGIFASFGLFFLFTVRRRGTDGNYLFRLFEFGGYAGLIIIAALTILYSQSRGPEAGILTGVFVFFPLLFWRWRAWKWLIGWLGVGLVLGGTLVLFNLPPGSTPLEPVFKIARQNDQIARLGEFFETNDGTGKVRQLIWKTVLEIMGEAAQKAPDRLIIGYGPESLYNKSPQHYQAELAQVEARNAIPDRSHNGYLDALVTTGIAGLVAYIAVVLAFFWYSFKFLRRTRRFEYQVLLAALISIMVAHQIEIQTGIQIVSSWMMFFTIIALAVLMGGLIYGRWDAVGRKPGLAPVEPVVEEPLPVAEPEPVMAAAVAATARNGAGSAKNKNKAAKETVPAKGPVSTKVNGKPAAPARNRDQGGAGSGNNAKAPGGGGNNPRRNGPIYATPGMDLEGGITYRQVKPWFYAAVAALSAAAFYFIWISNVSPIVADTLYKQGYNLSSANQWPQAVPLLKEALSWAPNEDYYELYLGQAYLQLATTESQKAATDKTALANMQAYLGASERELLRANQLAPLNPDHYANLARLYTRWADLEPARSTEMLNKAIGRYLQDVNTYAPRNARLWAELAATQASLATNRTDTDITGGSFDQAAMDKAIEYGQKSVTVDPKYDFNRLVLGDIYRFAGKKDEAGQQYLALAQIDPLQLASDERYTRRIMDVGLSNLVSVDDVLKAFDPAQFDTKDTDITKRNQDKAYVVGAQGAVYLYKGQLDKAQSTLNESIGMDATSPYVHAFLSVVYKRLGAATQQNSEASAARSLAKNQSNPTAVQQAIETLLAS